MGVMNQQTSPGDRTLKTFVDQPAHNATFFVDDHSLLGGAVPVLIGYMYNIYIYIKWASAQVPPTPLIGGGVL